VVQLLLLLLLVC
jgi:hypothetical protein